MVAEDTILKDTSLYVLALLESNLVDPESRGVDWIFSSYPDPSAADFPGYPVVTFTSPSTPAAPVTMKGDKWFYILTLPIDVFAKSAQVCDETSQNLMKVMKDDYANFQTEGLFNMKIDSSDLSVASINNVKVYNKLITYTWEFYPT